MHIEASTKVGHGVTIGLRSYSLKGRVLCPPILSRLLRCSPIMSISGVLLLLIIVTMTVAVLSGPVRLKFLKGVMPLKPTNYTDYYFSCTAVGRLLQWQLNGTNLLRAFTGSEDERHSTVVIRSNYNLTEVLLSVERTEEGNDKILDSILVISSSMVIVPFNVNCSNGPNNQTKRAGPVTSVTNSSYNSPNVVLDYITSSTIVRNTLTHIFTCVTNSSLQQIQVNDGVLIHISSSHDLGTPRVTPNGVVVVLIANDPLMRTLITVVRGSDVEVTCGVNDVETRLRSNSSHVVHNANTSTADNYSTSTLKPVNTQMGSNPSGSTAESKAEDGKHGSGNYISADVATIMSMLMVSLGQFLWRCSSV